MTHDTISQERRRFRIWLLRRRPTSRQAMPVFTIKAQDDLALRAVAAYRELCVAEGLTEQAKQVAEARALRAEQKLKDSKRFWHEQALKNAKEARVFRDLYHAGQERERELRERLAELMVEAQRLCDQTPRSSNVQDGPLLATLSAICRARAALAAVPDQEDGE